MPKLIDHYVLGEKIGAGQFGDVYYGYHQQTKQEVAIKAIKRETIKGKFYELLENEIKVLKTCDNPNIVKLYAIKKTANHFYLMMEYCNDGDMLAKVRKQGKLSEQQVIKYFCQILNAFQTLTKHKIMHRDFKLANILLHDGAVKVADFGFAKLLNTEDYATTMLGSPLNMAPEVLGGNKYNNKADIWSIGACVFEMLFGKPPYVASNMVDLLKLIKAKPVAFPLEPQINDTLKGIIRKMLTVDSKRRVSWNELFSHPINRYLDNAIRNEINLELTEDESLLLNTSKYYLKKNLVIDQYSDIKEKEKVNSYLQNVIENKAKKEEYEVEESEEKKSALKNLNISQISRKNSKKILHYRNLYAFLASVADEIINRVDAEGSEVAAYVIVRKILGMILWLNESISSEEGSLPQLENWSEYSKTPELQEIKAYIKKEYDVFDIFNQSLEPIIKQNFLNGKYENDVHELLNGKLEDPVYEKYLKRYVKKMTSNVVAAMLKKKETGPFKEELQHVESTLVACKYESIFGKAEFDFKAFHERFDGMSAEHLLLHIEAMLKQAL